MEDNPWWLRLGQFLAAAAMGCFMIWVLQNNPNSHLPNNPVLLGLSAVVTGYFFGYFVNKLRARMYRRRASRGLTRYDGSDDPL